MQGFQKFLLLPAFSALFLIPIQGQNTDSPYSRYGYGVLNNQSIGASKSMGGISYGVRGLNTNPGNPASYSGVDSLTFIFDIGISYQKSRLSENGKSQMDDNGGIDYVAMQFPVGRKIGVSVGLLPLSSVGYNFGTNETVDGLSSTKSFSGSGGFSQVYGGVAYSIINNLSIGANISYIFGNTSYTRTLSITSVPSANTQSWYHKLTLNMLKFDFGAQYTLPLNKNDHLTIGAVFTPAVKRSGKIVRITQISTSTEAVADTTKYTGNNAYTDLPQTFGAGFTWNKGINLVIGADATYQRWSKARYSSYMDDNMSNSNRFNDRWRFNAGFEYAIDPRDRSFMKRLKIRGGLNYSDSYINVIDNQGKAAGYKEYGATIGFGIPIRDVVYSGRTSYINIGFEYKNLTPDNKSLIKEQYFGVSLGVCLNELWFMKSKLR